MWHLLLQYNALKSYNYNSVYCLVHPVEANKPKNSRFQYLVVALVSNSSKCQCDFTGKLFCKTQK